MVVFILSPDDIRGGVWKFLRKSVCTFQTGLCIGFLTQGHIGKMACFSKCRFYCERLPVKIPTSRSTSACTLILRLPVNRYTSPLTFPSTIRLQQSMMTEPSTEEPSTRSAFCEKMNRLLAICLHPLSSKITRVASKILMDMF